jgi:hypothetical protein
MGWSLTQPQTYVYVAMGAGVLAEIAAVVSGKRQVLRPVLLTGIAIVSLAALGGATQVQHGVTWTNTSGSDKVKELIPFLIFNALPLLGVLVVLGVSLLGIAKSKPRLVPAMAPALLGLGMVLTGMVGHLVALFGPAQLAGTVFEEGEFIYVGYGALLIGLAAVSYWGPKLWGRVLPSSAVLGISGLAFLGRIADVHRWLCEPTSKCCQQLLVQRPARIVEYNVSSRTRTRCSVSTSFCSHRASCLHRR